METQLQVNEFDSFVKQVAEALESYTIRSKNHKFERILDDESSNKSISIKYEDNKFILTGAVGNTKCKPREFYGPEQVIEFMKSSYFTSLFR